MVPASMWDSIADSKVWDLLGKMGVGGLLAWAAKTLWDSAQRRIERGRRLVDEARPELLPRRWLGSQQNGRLHLENVGRGLARNLRVTFSGSNAVASGGEVAPGTTADSRELALGDSLFFRAPQVEPAHFTVLYEDRFRNDYKLILPVTQAPRADGEFNMAFDFTWYQTEEPRLGRRALYRLGR